MKLTYDDAGAGDPPLLFLHGWCCDRGFFAPQVSHFSPRHRVVAADQRGHGETEPAPDGYGVPAFADDAAELIANLGLDRPVLIGHSLGGCVALELAARQPQTVRAIVMVDPGPIVMSEDLRRFFHTLATSFEGPGGLEARHQFVAGMFAPWDDAKRKAAVIAGMAGVAEDVAVAGVRGIAEWDGPAALRACTVPIVSIGSASPVNDAGALRELCPHIVIGQTVGAGHFNQLEVPEQVNAMIERFLAISL